jgi:hypothetical protein
MFAAFIALCHDRGYRMTDTSHSIDWLSIFPRRDFRHPMAVRRGDAVAYFASRPGHAAILQERARWLDEAPEEYAAAPDDDAPLFAEALAAMRRWRDATSNEAEPMVGHGAALRATIEAGKRHEVDWVVLRADAVACGGAVCFPSGWSLREKMGLPLSHIHAAVPGLNDALQPRIDAFLATLSPGEAFERSNWGLSPSAELNRHSARQLKRFDAHTPLALTWVRLEEQILYRLPQTRAILFGIRVTLRALAKVARDPDVAARIAHALRTMPEAVAVYKGVAVARERLIRDLESTE